MQSGNTMKFRLPTGELRWISVYWAILGSSISVYYLIQENFVLSGIGFFILVMTLGIWFQLRSCAWLLLALYLLFGTIILVNEVIIAQQWLNLVQVILSAWFSYALFKWLSNSKKMNRQ